VPSDGENPPKPPYGGVRPSDPPEVLRRFESELDLVDLNARQLARRIGRGSPTTLDDLRSFGREGLLMAARTFDVGRGVPFRRWANLRIRGAILDGVRRWGALPRRVYRDLRALSAADTVQERYDEEDATHRTVTAEAADQRLASYLAGIATAMAVGTLAPAPQAGGEAAAQDSTPEELVAHAELMDHVRSILARLSKPQRALMERYYFADETLDQAAAAVGLSKSWGSRLHARAIDFIARELRNEDTGL
jgi:RNA polymerase sigma factor for flagellar operon FliA